MKKILLFAAFLVSTSLFSQIPDSLEVTLPWEIIYVADCQSAVGEIPTTTNEAVYITKAPEVILIEDSDGNCYKKILTYTILDWLGNATYTFNQIVIVDELSTLEGVSDLTLTYDDQPYAITAVDLVINADPTHIYSFDPNDEMATFMNFGDPVVFNGVYHVFVYDHNDKSVAEVNIIVSSCEDDVIIEVPASATIVFNGEYYIPFSEDLFDINIVYPCSDYALTIKRGGLDRVYASSIGETIEVKVEAKINQGSTFLFTEYILVTILGDGPDPIPMYIEEKTFTAGEEITLDIWSDRLDDLIAWQFRLNFENAKIIDIEEGNPFDVIPNNIFNEDKSINSLWTPGDAQAIDIVSNETWFTLTVLPSIDGGTFDIFTTANDPWSSVFIDDEGDVYDTEVDFNFQVAERNFLVSNEEVEHDNIIIHNNPASNRLVVSGFTEDMDISKISIFSFDGRQVMTKPFDRNRAKVDLDIARLSSGIYLLTLNGATPQTIRFVKI